MKICEHILREDPSFARCDAMSLGDCSAIDEAPAPPAERGGGTTYKMPEIVACSFGLDSVLLTDVSIMDSCYIWG